jgi:hypothetical protein
MRRTCSFTAYVIGPAPAPGQTISETTQSIIITAITRLVGLMSRRRPPINLGRGLSVCTR